MTDTAEAIRPDSSEHLPHPPSLPTFATEQEVRDFWDTQDTAPYWDQMEDVTDSPPPDLAIGPGRAGSRAPRRPPEQRFEAITLLLPRRLIDAVEQLADARVLSLDALLGSWIAERLEQEGDTRVR